ncbi:hypothetical protein TNCV_2855291, partial [Trichonephila clavipes]
MFVCPWLNVTIVESLRHDRGDATVIFEARRPRKLKSREIELFQEQE